MSEKQETVVEAPGAVGAALKRVGARARDATLAQFGSSTAKGRIDTMNIARDVKRAWFRYAGQHKKKNTTSNINDFVLRAYGLDLKGRRRGEDAEPITGVPVTKDANVSAKPETTAAAPAAPTTSPSAQAAPPLNTAVPPGSPPPATGSAVWNSPKGKIAVEITGAPQKGPDGNDYTPVKTKSGPGWVPTNEITSPPTTAPAAEEPKQAPSRQATGKPGAKSAMQQITMRLSTPRPNKLAVMKAIRDLVGLAKSSGAEDRHQVADFLNRLKSDQRIWKKVPQIRDVSDDLIQKLRENLDRTIDLATIMIEQEVKNPTVLNELYNQIFEVGMQNSGAKVNPYPEPSPEKAEKSKPSPWSDDASPIDHLPQREGSLNPKQLDTLFTEYARVLLQNGVPYRLDHADKSGIGGADAANGNPNREERVATAPASSNGAAKAAGAAGAAAGVAATAPDAPNKGLASREFEEFLRNEGHIRGGDLDQFKRLLQKPGMDRVEDALSYISREWDPALTQKILSAFVIFSKKGR